MIEKKPFEDGTILQSHSLGGPRESFAEGYVRPWETPPLYTGVVADSSSRRTSARPFEARGLRCRLSGVLDLDRTELGRNEAIMAWREYFGG